VSEAPATLFGLDPLLVSTLLLVATYAAIVVERVNRAISDVSCASLTCGFRRAIIEISRIAVVRARGVWLAFRDIFNLGRRVNIGWLPLTKSIYERVRLLLT